MKKLSIDERALEAVFLAMLLATASACAAEPRQYVPPECTTDSECGASSECQTFACVGGSCKVTFPANGTPVAVQAIGDCQSSVCNGEGLVKNIPDLADPDDDGNPCTLDACTGTSTQHGFLAAGTACEGSMRCDGVGTCVECLSDPDCMSGICAMNVCAPATCDDMAQNGSESDVDCGGADCAGCGTGKSCNQHGDCKSQVCQMVCLAPTCEDGTTNGMESAPDCGGPVCDACPVGAACNAGLDCTSHVCVANACAAPTCSDNTFNGSETDVDCGGSCPKCTDGRSCNSDIDCKSNNCCNPNGTKYGYCEKAGTMCPPATARSVISE